MSTLKDEIKNCLIQNNLDVNKVYKIWHLKIGYIEACKEEIKQEYEMILDIHMITASQMNQLTAQSRLDALYDGIKTCAKRGEKQFRMSYLSGQERPISFDEQKIIEGQGFSITENTLGNWWTDQSNEIIISW